MSLNDNFLDIEKLDGISSPIAADDFSRLFLYLFIFLKTQEQTFGID